MRKEKFFIYFLIIICSIAIVSVVIFKFIVPRINSSRIVIDNPEGIELLTLEGDKFTFSQITENEFDNYVFFFEISNCPSCIYKGIQELISLKKEGEYCFAIAIHDWVNDIKGWAENYNFSPFYIMKKLYYYKNINFKYLPVLLKYKKGKVKSYRYITF